METNSPENIEINLYDDLVKFNEMSSEERTAVAQTIIAESGLSEWQSAQEVEPSVVADITASEQTSFNTTNGKVIKSEEPQEPAAESGDMIFALSEPQYQDSPANGNSSDFVLSYQDQSEAAPTEQPVFTGHTEATLAPQPAVTESQSEPITSEPPEPHSVEASQLDSQPVDTIAAAPQEPLSKSEPITAAEKPATALPSAIVSDKQGVRITVREETAGSVTLSVADILGEDDFDDEQAAEAKPDIPIEASKPAQSVVAEESVTKSEALSEPAGAIDSPRIEEPISVAETTKNHPYDQASAHSTVSGDSPVSVDTAQTTASSDSSKSDSAKLEELMRATGPLKITGFLAETGKPEVVSDDTKIICPACGHISKSTDLLCLECGAFFDEPDSDVQVESSCADCGEKVEPDEVFCPACGSILLAH